MSSKWSCNSGDPDVITNSPSPWIKLLQFDFALADCSLYQWSTSWDCSAPVCRCPGIIACQEIYYIEAFWWCGSKIVPVHVPADTVVSAGVHVHIHVHVHIYLPHWQLLNPLLFLTACSPQWVDWAALLRIRIELSYWHFGSVVFCSTFRRLSLHNGWIELLSYDLGLSLRCRHFESVLFCCVFDDTICYKRMELADCWHFECLPCFLMTLSHKGWMELARFWHFESVVFCCVFFDTQSLHCNGWTCSPMI